MFRAVAHTPEQLPEGLAYRAFLSYSSSDLKIARRLHRKLEAYRLPRGLAGQPGAYGIVPRDLRPIFLDRSNAVAAPELEAYFRRELSRSEHLIVLCSQAAASPACYVGLEIETFRIVRPRGLIHSVIARDTAPSCFPEPLKVRRQDGGTDVPLAADLKPAARGGDGEEKAIVKLVAAIAGVDFDDIWRRHLRRRRWRMLVGSLVLILSVALVLLGGSATRAYYLAAEAAAMLPQDRDRALVLASQSLAWLRTERALDIVARARRIGSIGLEIEGEIKSAEYSPDGKSIVTTNGQNVASVLDAGTGRIRFTLGKHTGPVRYARFSPDGRHIVTASDDGTAIVWDSGGALVVQLDARPGRLTYAELSSDGATVLATLKMSDQKGAVAIWDLRSGRNTRVEMSNPARASFVMPGDRILMASNDAVTVRGAKWVDIDPRPLFESFYRKTAKGDLVPRDQDALAAAISRYRINDIKMSPDGGSVAIATDDGVRIWDAATGSLVQMYGDEMLGRCRRSEEEGSVRSLTFSPNGRKLLGVVEGAGACIVDLSSSLVRPLLDDNTENSMERAIYSPDGRYVVTQGSEESLTWDAASWQLKATFESSDVVRFSPDSRRVLSGNRIWDLSSLE